jgi:ABC-type dipeptide/oligopeptide/nickel transport system permease component
MVYFQTKNPILGKFWKALQWTMVYFMPSWNMKWPFGIFYGCFAYLVYCVKKNMATMDRW